MLLKLLFTLVALVAVSSCGKPPNSDKVLSSMSKQELDAMPKELVEDAKLDVPGLINKYGYIADSYDVETEDKYIVTVHRIVGKQGVKYDDDTRPAVFMMHGFMGSSADWVINGPQRSLAYLLSDAGYDVWLGNARGNFYSRKHPVYDPDTSRLYWQFSWHEIGHYDLPAMVDFALAKSRVDKLHFIAHSQGTTTFFVMASTRPEYNDKIITMQAFAPIAYNVHSGNPLMQVAAQYAGSFQVLLTLLGRNEFMPKSKFIAEMGQKYCNVESQYIELCVMGLWNGDDTEHVDPSMIPVYLAHTPAGASTRQSVHFMQGYASGKFRQYDYGFIANVAVYNSISPPVYRLNKITCPVALHYADNDAAVHPLDLERLAEELKNPIGKFPIKRSGFGHTGFIWATDAKTILYDDVMAMMKEYESK